MSSAKEKKGKNSKWHLMGIRASIVKRWFLGHITHTEFLTFARQFCEAFESTYEGGSDVTVSLYRKTPLRSTIPGLPCEQKWRRQMDKERKMATLHSLEDLTEEQFSAAAYIQLRIEPKDEKNAPSYACGWVSCKGLLLHHILFQVSLEDEATAVVWQKMFDQPGAPPNLRYALGDGWKRNIHLSLH